MISFDELIRTEEGFENIMLKELEPYLETVCERGSFESFDGTKIAYRKFINPNAKGNIMIVHGFSEIPDKYNEMIYGYYENGYSVYMTDLRGHGDSGRSVEDPSMVDVKSFDSYIKDLKIFYDLAIKDSPLPKYIFGQSMGGAIAIYYTERYCDDFEKAVFASPMVRMKTGKFPFWSARVVAKLETLVGNGTKYAPGQHEFVATSHLERSSCRSAERYEYMMNKRRSEVKKQTWGGSYNWVSAATSCSAYIAKEKHIKKIKAAVLLLMAGTDHMVDTEATKAFGDKLSNGRDLFFAEARHEIYHSLEADRVKFYEEVFKFLA